MIYDIEGSYHIFSPSFEKWIRNELLAAPGEEESQGNIERWLKSNTRGNLKDVNKLLPAVKKKYWNIMTELIKDFSMEFAVVVVFEIGKIAIGRR